MKEITIETRTKEIDSGKYPDFVIVDLKIDGITIDAGDEPISNHSFWKDIEEASQRAIKRIEDGNPKMNFDFHLSTMEMSEEDKKAAFIRHLSNKNKRLDITKFMEIIESELDKIELTGPEGGEHPNPFMKFPIKGDLIKMVCASVVDIYINGPKPEDKKPEDPLAGEPNWELIEHLSTADDDMFDKSMTDVCKELLENKDTLTKEDVANKFLYMKDMSQYSALAASAIIQILHMEWERMDGKIEADNANCKWRNEF